MTAKQFRDALNETLEPLGVPVYHILATPEDACPVLCWQETGASYMNGDDSVAARVLELQLDLFTETEYDETPDIIDGLLARLHCGFYQDNVSYDPDRDEWRYIWNVELLGV